jgi:histidyl-tRNA synthetase
MQTPTSPKGTRDFYPEDMALREYIFTSWDKTCRRYGFEKVDAPIFEHLELFTQKSGEEVENQLYTFKDKSGRQLALRPEITPSLARMVALKGSSLKIPIRWYSIPRLFRYEKMQKGRLREFFQLNADIYGIPHATADAELIALSVDTMKDLGFTSDEFTVHVSSRDLLEELFVNLSIPRDSIPSLFAVLDKQHKLPEEEFLKELNDFCNDAVLADKVNTVLRAGSLEEIKALAGISPAVDELDNLFALIKQYGMAEYVTFDIGIVRGLAYYTGIVFELLDKKRDLRSIAGGGRYDRLVKLYGGPDTPASGFATGDVVLAEMMKENNLLPKQQPRSTVYVVSINKDTPQHAVKIARELRDNTISCEFALKAVNVGKQMKLADAARAKIVLFTGGDEEKEGKIKLRNMVSGEEMVIPIDSVSEEIQNLLADNK